jgi:ferritin-like metal-binding protein YciE
MSSQKTLEDLFLDEIRDVYDAEKRLTKALPKMAKSAESPELRQAFEDHLRETENHVSRLEEVFKAFDKTPRGKKCKAMEGIIEEGSDVMKEDAEEAAHDACLIGAAQKAEHYEIASYGTLATWSKCLGREDITSLLEETLAEEKKADEKLTKLASEINLQAVHAGGNGQMMEEEEE